MKRLFGTLLLVFAIGLLYRSCAQQSDSDKRVAYEFTKMNYQDCRKHLNADADDLGWRAFLAVHTKYDPTYETMPDDVYKDCMASGN